MKILILAAIFLIPTFLKAQPFATLGRSKESIRLDISHVENKHIKWYESNDSDMMIDPHNLLKTIIYYKNNISIRISVTMLGLSKEVLQQTYLRYSYKKVNDNELINSETNVRVDFIANKKKNTVTIIQTPLDKNKKINSN